MPGCSCVLGALAVSQWHVTAASPLVKNVCFHSSCVQLPNNVPRAFSADLKCIRPFLFPSVKRHGRLGRSSSRPGRRRMTRSDLGDYCYTRQKKCYMFVKSCLSSMSFCVGYRSAPGQDTGVDGCTTNRLCIASKPPSEHDGMSSLGGCCSPLAPALPHSHVNVPKCRPRPQPDKEMSCVPKWRFISKQEVDYCSLALCRWRALIAL